MQNAMLLGDMSAKYYVTVCGAINGGGGNRTGAAWLMPILALWHKELRPILLVAGETR